MWTKTCLLALGLGGDLGELGFYWSGAVGLYAWPWSLVILGHCRVASDGPRTAPLVAKTRRSFGRRTLSDRLT